VGIAVLNAARRWWLGNMPYVGRAPSDDDVLRAYAERVRRQSGTGCFICGAGSDLIQAENGAFICADEHACAARLSHWKPTGLRPA